MIIREARMSDILQIQVVRNAVKENTLSDPALVTDSDCEEFLFRRGKGWICETDNCISGFAIADLEGKNIWALFLHPDVEGMGIGKKLHNIMLDWYFSQTSDAVWLSTAPGTRAEGFYRRMGWMETGVYGKGEIKFEMSIDQWRERIR